MKVKLTYLCITKNRGVEQLVARRAHNPKVVGSSPAAATKKGSVVFNRPFFIGVDRVFSWRGVPNYVLIVGGVKSLLPPQAAEYCFDIHIIFEILQSKISKMMCISKYNLAGSAMKRLFTQSQVLWIGVMQKGFLRRFAPNYVL